MEQQLWILPFVFHLLKLAGLSALCGRGESEMGCPPFSQIVEHLNKNLFPFPPAFASRVVFCGGRVEPPLLISNVDSTQTNFRYIY